MNQQPTMITLALRGERPVAVAPEDVTRAYPPHDDGVIAMGGTGQEVLLVLKALLARDGRRVHALAVDNDHRLVGPLRLADGALIQLLASEHMRLGEGYDRTEAQRFPLLRQRYEEARTGLLRRVDAYQSFAATGRGAAAIRALTALDVDRACDPARPVLPGRLRAFLRFWQEEPTGPLPWWRRERAREERAPRRPRLFLIASGSGGAGSTLSLLLPYLIRREARALGLPVPTCHLLLIGPHCFTGLTQNVHENYAACLADLRLANSRGLDWPLLDDHAPGYLMSGKEPPYNNVWLCDAPTSAAPLDGPTSLPLTPAARAAVFEAVARTLHLLIVSDALAQFESMAVNPRPDVVASPWGVLASSGADAHVATLAGALAAARVARRLEAIGD
jgi:hypothetical protein